MEEMMMKALVWGMEKSPMLVGVFASVGLVRSVNKLLMTFVGELVLITPTGKDDEFLQKVLNSKGYKAFVFIVDYAFSLKIKK